MNDNDNLVIDIQIISTFKSIPEPVNLVRWTKAALKSNYAEITIRVVDEDESANLNKTYRHKSGPTNIISFPMTSPHAKQLLLGDLVVCAPLAYQEAINAKKSLDAHWAHLIVHGTLHLQGYDHIEDDDAQAMEQEEISILSTLGVQNPYA